MKKTNVLLIALIGLMMTMTMCKKDDNDPPYVGSWESEEFSMGDVNVKMGYDFTTTNFDGEILVAGGPDIYVGYLGLKGDISEKENQTLDFSITDIGQPDVTGAYDYKNRVADAGEFDALYNGFLSNQMPKDFEAIYKVTGNELDLYIPAIQDTLELYAK